MKQILHFIKILHSLSGKKLYLNLVGMIAISLFESVGIFLIIPLLGIVGIMIENTNDQPLISWIAGLFDPFSETTSLLLVLGIYLILMLGQSVFQQQQLILNVKIQQGFLRHLREITYKSLIQANWNFFLNKRKSDIINTMTTEIAKVGGGVQLCLQFLTALVFTFIQIGISFYLSATMTILVLLFGIALIYFNRKFINKSNLIGKDTVSLSKKYLAVITDHFNGIKDIKSNTLEESHFNWFKTISKSIERNVITFIKLKAVSQLIYKVVSAFLIVLFVFFSIKMLQAQPAQLILIIIIFSRLWPRFSAIQSNLEQLGAMIPSFHSLIELQKQSFEAREINEIEYQNIKPLKINRGLECQDICFRYQRNEEVYALENINLKIPINQMTAIVGHSGAGKSTLIDLLMGLNQPEKGSVLIDGELLNNENLLSLRRSISYVPQDPFLFNTSIKENLLMIEPDASEKQIWEALEFSAAADFVKKLPNGLETIIGDRGIKLSGGERQRLVLARAILRKPAILVLDEATSALDTENESKIQAAIEKLKGKMTIIVIAHRLSTIKNADQVIVLDHGEIIQIGEFNQLANDKKGVFSHLLQKQVNAIS